MRFLTLVLTGLLLSASACFAETAEQEQRTRLLSLQKLAAEARELERCQAVVSVENIAEFQPIVGAYFRKTDELAKSIEDFVSRYAAKRSKQETVLSFKYRIWEASLRSGVEKARPVSALNRESCGALARTAS